MDKDEFINDKLSAADILAALKQKNFSAGFFAENINYLLNDFFVCTSKLTDNRIEVTLMNGQKFSITVDERK